VRQPRKRLAEAPRDTGRALDSRSVDALLGFRVRMLEQAFMRRFAHHMDPLEVTPTLYSILVLIRDNPLCRQSDLSHALNMHQPNLVERVGLLITRGLVARREDPTDRRASALELTFAGRHFMEKLATPAHATYETEMRQLLGPERYDALMTLIPAVNRDGE
jgi:DNA-binding MarR family transcriptional regulator